VPSEQYKRSGRRSRLTVTKDDHATAVMRVVWKKKIEKQ